MAGRKAEGKSSQAASPGPSPDRVDEAALPPSPLRLPPLGDWFAPDATRHLLDKPKFCPMCGDSLENGLTSEWWHGHERVFLTWCAGCKWTGNVVLFDKAIIEEPEH